MLEITTVQQILPKPINQSDQTTKPSTSSATADSSDIIIQNPDDFKDHMMPASKLQLPI